MFKDSIIKYKKIVIGFIFLVGLPGIALKFGEYYANPADKHRAEFASPTAHLIFIDDHYHVATTSGKMSYLVYSEIPGETLWDEVYSQSVDKLNWTEDYILVGAQSESTGKYSFLILDKTTGETDGYANEEEFARGKKEKDIDVEVLDKKYFDWY